MVKDKDQHLKVCDMAVMLLDNQGMIVTNLEIEEKMSGMIDRELQSNLQFSQDALDANVMIVS